MQGLRTGKIVGRQAVDVDGCWFGEVKDTWPLDGGGEAVLALVKVGRRFPRLRYLPLRSAELHHFDLIRFPLTRYAIDDAPSAEDCRWGEPGRVALAHWTLADD